MADSSYYGSAASNGAPKKSGPPGGNIDQGKIFVGGLSWQTTEESLRWHFEQYGPVASVEVMRDRVTGDPRGFAFVVFQDQATVDLVMAETKHEINHKIVDVKRAQARGIAPPSIHHDGNKPQHTPQQHRGGGDTASVSSDGHGGRRNNHHGGGGGFGGGLQRRSSNNSNPDGGEEGGLTPEQLCNKVFVGGIPAHIDRDELRTIFEQFGPVVDSIVMIDQVTNRSRCFGFVTFENGSSGAQRAIDAQPLQIGQRNVEVKLATPKAEQKRMPPTSAGPKHVGLRAGMSSSTSSGEYAGLAVAYGRSGWRAGYGTKAFGKAGWAIEGWDDGGAAPERAGFSFDMLRKQQDSHSSTSSRHRHRDHHVDGPPSKRPRH